MDSFHNFNPMRYAMIETISKYKTRITVILAVSILYASAGSAQELMLKKDQLMLKGTAFYTEYDKIFDQDGQRKSIQKTIHSGFHVQAQAGIHPRWNLMLSGAPLMANSIRGTLGYKSEWGDNQPDFEKNVNVIRPGDFEAGVRYAFAEKQRVSACFSFYQGIGTGYRDRTSFLNTGFADFNNRIQFDADYRPGHKIYMSVMMGYNNHNKKFSDEFQAGAKLVYQAGQSFRAEINGLGIYNFENGSGDRKKYHTGLYQNRFGAIITGLELCYDSEKGLTYFLGIKKAIRAQFYFPSAMLQCGVSLKLSGKKSEDFGESN